MFRNNSSKRKSIKLFNQASDFFRKVRFAINASSRKDLLVEIIEKCLYAIQLFPDNGDAYVLLANAYSLIGSDLQDTKKMFFEALNSNKVDEFHKIDHFFYDKLGAAVIFYWYSTKLKEPKYTDNTRIGYDLLEGIKRTTKLLNKDKDPENLIKEYCENLLSVALDFAILERINSASKMNSA